MKALEILRRRFLTWLGFKLLEHGLHGTWYDQALADGYTHRFYARRLGRR